MSVKASAKSVNVAPRKAGVVVALVRGRSVNDALTILQHTPRRSALAIKKAIESAKANAENNHGYKPETLSISSIYVTPGSRLKRLRPAARSRALPFQRKTSHIFVELDGQKREKKKPANRKKETK
jgi:large subunit ribosomal protein L22